MYQQKLLCVCCGWGGRREKKGGEEGERKGGGEKRKEKEGGRENKVHVGGREEESMWFVTKTILSSQDVLHNVMQNHKTSCKNP